jgi:hypothetical protein
MGNNIFSQSRGGRAGRLVLGLAAFVALATGPAQAAGKYFCVRELTPEETAEVTRVIQVLGKALSAAPAGWSIRSDDTGVDCFGMSKPGPVPVFYMRSYLHLAPSGQPSAQEQQAHIKEIEQRLAALRAQEQQTASKVTAARAARDQGAVQAIQQQIRDLRQQQGAALRELTDARNQAQRSAGERRNAEDLAAHKKENSASFSVSTNRDSFSYIYPGGKQIKVAGVPLAIQDTRNDGFVVTQLYFGRNAPAAPTGQQVVKVPIDGSAPITDVQAIVVRINGWPDVTEQLLKGLDVAAVKTLVKRKQIEDAHHGSPRLGRVILPPRRGPDHRRVGRGTCRGSTSAARGNSSSLRRSAATPPATGRFRRTRF